MTITLTTAIATTRTSWTLTDGSTYTSPLRTACGVFVSSAKMNYDNTVADTLTVTGNNADPETDTSWTITYTDDGWYRTYFVVIPDYNAGTTYAAYAAVFNPSDNKVYRSKLAANTGNLVTNTTWWEEITSPASLAANKDTATESANIDSVVYHRVFSANGQYEFANQLSDQSKFVDDDELETLQNYNVFAQWLDAIAVADSRSEVLDGEFISRKIQSKFLAD